MKNLKKTAAAALIGCAICSSVFAADEGKASIVINGQITGFEAGRIWIIEQADGTKIRADLGKYGGRLWRLKEMEFTGSYVQDAKGPLFLMDKVKFEDPAIDERLNRPDNGKQAAVSKVQDDRDVAFYYPDQVPTDNKTYITQNVKGVHDLSAYREMTSEQMKSADANTKVTLIGRPIKTIVKDQEMLFWDQANKPFRVVMNGAFIPLGQRSFVYGILTGNADGVPRLSLDKVESIE